MTTGAGLQLQKHFEKTEYQMQHPRITDVVLTASAKWLLLQLELEREAARDEQGHPERVQDWWAAPTMVGKKKRKGKMMSKKQGATAVQSISAEGLRDQVGAWALGGEELLEGGDGSFLEGEQESEGFKSPVVMSPVGSVLGDGEEEAETEQWERVLTLRVVFGCLPSARASGHQRGII